MELVVLCEHIDFAIKLITTVLSFHELLLIITAVVLPELVGSPGLLRRAWLLQFHYHINVPHIPLRLTYDVFSLQCLPHHDGQASLTLPAERTLIF